MKKFNKNVALKTISDLGKEMNLLLETYLGDQTRNISSLITYQKTWQHIKGIEDGLNMAGIACRVVTFKITEALRKYEDVVIYDKF